MGSENFSRRRFLGATAAAAVGPYVRTSRAAGSLTVGFWDHWVPGANDALTKLCNEWAAKEKVDLKVDFITSQGNKLLLTITSEAQAKSGHDILAFGTWYVTAQAKNLEPVDDIVQSLIKQHGAPAAAVEYLGKQDGHWIGVPATAGSQMKGPCGRLDLFKQHAGIELDEDAARRKPRRGRLERLSRRLRPRILRERRRLVELRRRIPRNQWRALLHLPI